MSDVIRSGRIFASHVLSLVGYILLLGLLLASSYWFPPPQDTSLLMVLAIKLVPLLILMPGLVKDSLRAHIWLCFVLLLYFTQSVLSLTQTNGHWLFGVICAITVIVFLSSMMHVHWSKKAGRPLNPRY